MNDEHTPERFLVGLALLTLLSEIADDRPLVIAIDDAHWLDRPSLDAIAFASRRLHAEPDRRSSSPPATTTDSPRSGPRSGWLDLGPLDPTRRSRHPRRCGAAPDPTRSGSCSSTRPVGIPSSSWSSPESGQPLTHRGSDSTTPSRWRQRRASSACSQDESPRLPVGHTEALLVAAASDLARDARRCFARRRCMGLPGNAFAAAERDGLLTITADIFRFRHPVVRSCVYHAAAEVGPRAAHEALARPRSRPRPNAPRGIWPAWRAEPNENPPSPQGLEEAAGKARVRAGHAAASRRCVGERP